MVDLGPSLPLPSGTEDGRTATQMKQERRRHYRRIRRAFYATEKYELASQLLCHHMRHLWESTCAGTDGAIAAFLPYGGGPDIMGFLDHVRSTGNRVLVPHTAHPTGIGWGDYSGPDCVYQPAQASVRQPTGPVLPASVVGEAQMIVVPALAVDQQGRRLGQGGGWYDRALQHRVSSAVVVATVFDVMRPQQALPEAAHDIRMDGVVTESGFYRAE